jgi:Ni/Co efflux regulator RcnB
MKSSTIVRVFAAATLGLSSIAFAEVYVPDPTLEAARRGGPTGHHDLRPSQMHPDHRAEFERRNIQSGRPVDARSADYADRGGRDDRRFERDGRQAREAQRNDRQARQAQRDDRGGGGRQFERDGRAYPRGYVDNRPVYNGNNWDQRRWRQAEPRRYYPNGQVPYAWRNDRHVVHDWHNHGLYAPPMGHHWIQGDGGNYLLAAVATGLIVNLLLAQ